MQTEAQNNINIPLCTLESKHDGYFVITKGNNGERGFTINEIRTPYAKDSEENDIFIRGFLYAVNEDLKACVNTALEDIAQRNSVLFGG